MTRLRSSGFPPRSDYERNLARLFWLPTARTFSVVGQARISPLATDQLVDATVGATASGGDAAVTGVASSSRLTGNVAVGAAAAIDGSTQTAWQSAFSPTTQDGQWVQYTLAAPLSVDTMDLAVVADGHHSIPTALEVSAGGTSERVGLPAIADSVPGGVAHVTMELPHPVDGSVVRVTVAGSRTLTTVDYTTQARQALPVGIAELGIPGLAAPTVPAELPGTCRDDLLSVDGAPVWISVTGTTADALARDPLDVSLCGPDAAGITLAAGDHTLVSALGETAGFDLDELALASAAGGAAAPVLPGGQLQPPASSPVGTTTVVHQTATKATVEISGIRSTTAPFEFVLGQSINSGWSATAGDHALRPPVLVDAFANGWWMDPSRLAGQIHDGTLTMSLVWTPQRNVNVALLVSAAVVVLCVVLAMLPFLRRRRRRGADDATGAGDGGTTAGGRWTSDVVAADAAPELVAPAAGGADRYGWGTSVLTGALYGALAAFISAPTIGILVGLALLVVLRVPRARLGLGLVATGLVLATGVGIMISQGVDPGRANGGWPSGFGFADGLAWGAVLFLGADGVVELLARMGRTGGRTGPGAQTDEGAAGDGTDAPVG